MSKTLKILITGAARGIGMATAQLLASRGHSVVATDISPLSESEGIQARREENFSLEIAGQFRQARA